MKKDVLLVVEDDEEIRFTLKKALEDAGFEVFVASEGTGAVQRLLDNPEITTIISDVRMPVFGGDYWLKFLDHFCSDRYRIILQTSCSVDPLPKNTTLLQKPYGLSQLLSVVQEKPTKKKKKAA